MREKIIKVFKNILILCGIFFIWKMVSVRVNPVFIPDPVDVFRDFVMVLKNGMLLKAVKYSFMRISVAALLSAILSIPIGILIHNYKIFNELLNPIISVLRYIPITAFYPLLIMWFGIDEVMKIVFLFIATFVYMMPSVMLALGDIKRDLIDTGLTLGMSKTQTILKIQIPASLPGIINSFIVMYGIGFTYIAVAETVNAKYGLGYIIQQSSSRGRTDMVFMAIIVIICISIVFDTIASSVVRKVFRWKYLRGDDID